MYSLIHFSEKKLESYCCEFFLKSLFFVHNILFQIIPAFNFENILIHRKN